MITLLIAIFAMLSYSSGVTAVFKGEYRPSIYSRAVWLLIATNSLIGVITLHNNPGTIALALISAIGSLAILIGAFKYSVKTFGSTEIICTILLLVSLVLWLTLHNPILNLTIGLIAHFIGAIPSLKEVILRPEKEHLMFWLFFALASILAFLQADKSVLRNFLYPLYYAIFDSLMTLLISRQYLKKQK